MGLIAVSSSAIRAVGYDAFSATLAVVFTTSDKVYLHPRVPYALFVGLLHAESPGAFYNRYLRGKYK